MPHKSAQARQPGEPPTIENGRLVKPPAHIAQLIDDITDDDRLWFLAHPGETHRERAYFEGECWPLFPDANTVIVQQLRPGVRSRAPIKRLYPAGIDYSRPVH